MSKPTKPETLLELVERLDREHDALHEVEFEAYYEWPRISKAVRALSEYVESSGHPAELELLARLDREE